MGWKVNVSSKVSAKGRTEILIAMVISHSGVVEINLGLIWLDRSENTVCSCTWTSNRQVCDISS